ncbi:EAL domain-containing protein [Trinickia mobilis]|uniref:EAL domain-containing protein n=1 Tax=Trinickia mobilis TaxID=2816356 RepID=UPI001A901D15|nr:EAL domain-containing protein [Trinickia mobilis]
MDATSSWRNLDWFPAPATILASTEVIFLMALLCLLGLGCWALYERRFTPDARLVRAVKAGLKRKEFNLEYQPVVSTRSGKCVGVEVLLRWMNGIYGLRGPLYYQAKLEGTSGTAPLTRFVLSTAMKELGALERAASLYVAVNVAWSHLESGSFMTDVINSAGHLLPRLVLEVTEGGTAKSTQRVLDVMSKLRKKRVRFALSGVGVTPANFALLEQFKFELAKIERQTLSLENDERVQALSALADLGRRLGATVVAEGVESVVQYQAVCRARVDMAQGFFLGKAMRLIDLSTFLESNESRFSANRKAFLR